MLVNSWSLYYLPLFSFRVPRGRLDLQSPSDMPFLQPTAITALLRFHSALARLQRAVKARMVAFPFFELRVTVTDGALLSSTRKGKSHFTSPCMKRRSLFSPLKSSSPISSPRSSGKSSSSQNPVNVEAGNE